MGSTINTQPGVYKEIRYIKIPDRRLISGLLYINVVNHNENDGKEDFIQQCHNVGTNVHDHIEYANPFGGYVDHDRGRTGMKHTFADYDCFVFHVCGGMVLSGDAAPIGLSFYVGIDDLVNNNFAQSSGLNYVWTDGSGALTTQDQTARWYIHNSDPFGDFCCHFVKYHLLSRINNASGHHQATNNQEFYKHKPTLTKTWTQNLSADLTEDVNSANAAIVDANDKWIYSHGTYDTKDARGTSLTKQSLVGLQYGNTANSAYKEINNDAEADEGNTYFAPVDKIAIYGKHQLTVASHRDSGGSNTIWSNASGTGAVHITDFWDLVIEIGLRGNNPGGQSSNSNPTKSIFNSQINISFQPFGETASFAISDTEHTS